MQNGEWTAHGMSRVNQVLKKPFLHSDGIAGLDFPVGLNHSGDGGAVNAPGHLNATLLCPRRKSTGDGDSRLNRHIRHIGILTAISHLAQNEDAAEFVFVGELRHLKGVDILLKAIAALRNEYPVTAYIAGGGGFEDDIGE